MKNGVTFGTNHTDSFLGKFRVKGSSSSSGRGSPMVRSKHGRFELAQAYPSLQQAGGLGGQQGDSRLGGGGYRLYYWPRSNTLTPPSPPTWYRYSWSSARVPWCVILMTPLTSLAAPVSSSRRLSRVSASCARLSANHACCFSSVVSCSLMSGSSAATVTMAACVFCEMCQRCRP